jgi:hypothetical protein
MTIQLTKNIAGPSSKYLVFTSAGNHARLNNWLKGCRNFDLWICYYGDEKDRYKEQGDFYIAKKGGKFPSLHYAYQHWQKILSHYQAILVLDDDIIINASDISRLFEIRELYDLWLIQPAFNPIGKTSHLITIVNPYTFLRYTNFVEVTCPLFRRDKLDAFMKVYDPALVGYGIDYWYMDSLAPDFNGKVAIIDAISCINPQDWFKGGRREIDLLQDTPARIENWERIKRQYNIKERELMELDIIKNPMSISTIIRTAIIRLIRVAANFETILKTLTNWKKLPN